MVQLPGFEDGFCCSLSLDSVVKKRTEPLQRGSLFVVWLAVCLDDMVVLFVKSITYEPEPRRFLSTPISHRLREPLRVLDWTRFAHWSNRY